MSAKVAQKEKNLKCGYGVAGDAKPPPSRRTEHWGVLIFWALRYRPGAKWI